MTTVLLTDVPQMLRNVLTDLLGSRPDFKVVRGSLADGLAAAALRAKADIAIVESRDAADPAAIDAGLVANLAILAISRDGSSAYLHKIQCETSRVEDVSPNGILNALASSAPVR